MGYGNLRFQLLHVLAAGPRISKPLDDIVQLGLFLSGPEFGLVVFRGRWVNYPLLPHRTRGGTPNGILRYRICRHVGTWLPLPSWGPPMQCCLLDHAVSFVKWRWNLLRGGCNDKKNKKCVRIPRKSKTDGLWGDRVHDVRLWAEKVGQLPCVVQL